MELKNHKLGEIQNKLVAKKDAYNSFGKYKYRSCESILAALKPVLAEYGYSVILSDDIFAVADRVYVKATCSLLDEDKALIAETHAFAREALIKKGMDDAQCTGAASSYARKYALCGMFAIDDSSVDPDATNKHEDETALTESDKEAICNAESKAELVELCKTLVAAGRDKEAVSKAYKAASATLTK